MRKTKILVIMALILTLLVGTMSSAGVGVEAASNLPEVEISFLDACTDAKDGRADATLIQCNGEFVLVDCGVKEAYASLKKQIIEKYKSSKDKSVEDNEKVILKAVVITHNHSDHMGAIKKLLNDKEITVQSVVYSNITEKDSSTKEDNEKNLKTIQDAVASAANNNTEFHEKVLKSLANPKKYKNRSLKPYTIDIGDAQVKVYRPIHKNDYISSWQNGKKDSAETRINNRSMIVRVVPKESTSREAGMTALLLGDLYINGLIAAKNVYGDRVFSTKNYYKVCKFGHHGFRMNDYWSSKSKKISNGIAHLKKKDSSSEDSFWVNKNNAIKYTRYIDLEVAFYNKYVAAQNYVLNVTTKEIKQYDRKKKKDSTSRYNIFVGGSLKDYNEKTSTCVKYNSQFSVNSSGDFFNNINDKNKCKKIN